MEDLRKALEEINADVVLLPECGEIGIGLDQDLWLTLLSGICGPGFKVTHQSHYTSIVRSATMEGKLNELETYTAKLALMINALRSVCTRLAGCGA